MEVISSDIAQRYAKYITLYIEFPLAAFATMNINITALPLMVLTSVHA